MRVLMLLLLTCFIFSSCKKEEPYDADKHITVEHWYKLSGSADTLFSVYMPSAFTPNGNGVNDSFIPLGYYNLDHFRVYDRSGAVIFETTDKNKGWNGRKNNSEIIQIGVYMYRLIVYDTADVRYDYTARVTLYN